MANSDKMTKAEAGRLGGLAAAKTRPREQYVKMNQAMRESIIRKARAAEAAPANTDSPSSPDTSTPAPAIPSSG